MLKLPSVRTTNLIAFSVCLLLLATAAYMQYILHLKPCPLCIVQREIILTLGLLFLFGGLINFKRVTYYIYHVIIFLIACFGAIVAGRHVWLEMQPIDSMNGCGPSLTYMLEMLPLNEVIKFLFVGSGDCREVTWRFLNLSISHWALLFFIAFILVALSQLVRKKQGPTKLLP